ncbi:hypothetical protein CDAR_489421 [Caerostris darwini]|uniref:LAGLIDADG homing endonuclease n=1 Tax=Caerostris darwini TaxID=1538125 RepID=A0AAV4U051_9ARAC|nr:hypothetical protein CDAR_489421 [Caerostris darwini]
MEDKKSSLPRSICSEDALKYIFGSSTKKGFPIYCDAIIPQFEKVSLQLKLLEYKIYTRNISQEIVLDGGSVVYMLNYLSKIDIFHLILAFSNVEKRKCRTDSKRKLNDSISFKEDALPNCVRRKHH